MQNNYQNIMIFVAFKIYGGTCLFFKAYNAILESNSSYRLLVKKTKTKH